MKKLFTYILALYMFSGQLQSQCTLTPLGPSDYDQASFNTVDYTSIVVDSSNNTYIIFSDADYDYKATVRKHNGNSWETVGLPGFSLGAVEYTDIAIASNGTLYVVYKDLANISKATVMTFNGTEWITLGNAGFSSSYAFYTKITVDNSGVPYVVYQDAANDSRATVMKYDGLSWLPLGNVGFSQGQADYLDIAFDLNEVPYVVYKDYYNNQKATVMKYDNNNWINVGTAGFTPGNVSYTNIVIDSIGAPYIVYRDGNSSNRASVMKYDGATWLNVGNPGFSSAVNVAYTSITLDEFGTPHVAFRGSNSKATAMKFNGNTWTNIGYVFSDGAATHTNIVIDTNGNPLVVYVNDADENKAKVMKYDGASWVTLGTRGLSNSLAYYSDMALDNNGTPYIVFEDRSISKKIIVMKYNNSWESLGIVETNAGNPKIAIDPLGVVYVIYEDHNFGYYKITVKKYINDTWITVGSQGFSVFNGFNPVIAIDSNGVPFASFTDDQGDFYVMKFDGNLWAHIGPDVNDNNGVAKNLVIDKYSNLYVVTSGANVDVRKFNGNTWEYLDYGNLSDGQTPNIAIDQNGTPYVVCIESYANIDQKISVKKYDGNSWQIVGSPYFSEGKAFWPDIAIDGYGNPYVIYADDSFGTRATIMKYNGQLWSVLDTPGFNASSCMHFSNYADVSISIDKKNGNVYASFISGDVYAYKINEGFASINNPNPCEGDSVLFTAEGGTSYTWSGPNNFSSAIPSPTVSNVSTTDAGIYFVTITDSTCINTKMLTLEINSLPLVTYSIPNDQDTLCSSSASFLLIGGMPEGGTYMGAGVNSNNFYPSIAGSGEHNITYTYMDTNGCVGSDSNKIFIDVCTNINLIEDENIFLVYPNPSKDIFTFTSFEKISSIEIYDVTKRLIYKAAPNNNRININLTTKNAGAYFYKIICSDNISYQGKLLKQ